MSPGCVSRGVCLRGGGRRGLARGGPEVWGPKCCWPEGLWAWKVEAQNFAFFFLSVGSSRGIVAVVQGHDQTHCARLGSLGSLCETPEGCPAEGRPVEGRPAEGGPAEGVPAEEVRWRRGSGGGVWRREGSWGGPKKNRFEKNKPKWYKPNPFCFKGRF